MSANPKPKTSPHKTKAVRIWADVDTGIADLVLRLNRIPGVRTHASCQGGKAYLGYVMCSWTPQALKLLRKHFDVMFPKGSNGFWGYVYKNGGTA